MKHYPLLAMLLAGVTQSATPHRTEQTGSRCDASRALRVLFVGNSLTYVQNVPRMVEDIAASLPGPCIETEMIAAGGATLEEHWESDSVARRIRDGHWTHVVLNDQSTFGESWFVNGRLRVGGSAEELMMYSARFADVIRGAHAKPLLYAHWTNDGTPARDQQALDAAFARVARDTRSTFIPVGDAIKQMRSTMEQPTPYNDDAHHLSSAGAYLAALVTYGSLTGRSPSGAMSRLSGEAVELQRGIVFKDSIVALVDLPRAVADQIQEIAGGILRDSRAHSNSQLAPLSDDYPRVTRGDRIQGVASLKGHWSGTSMFLPTPSNEAVTVDLFVSGEEDADSAVVQLPKQRAQVRGATRFSGRAEVSVKGDVVFIRARVAPNGVIAQFRGTVHGGTLTGVGEVHSAPPNAFNSIGTFQLRRD